MTFDVFPFIRFISVTNFRIPFMGGLWKPCWNTFENEYLIGKNMFDLQVLMIFRNKVIPITLKNVYHRYRQFLFFITKNEEIFDITMNEVVSKIN